MAGSFSHTFSVQGNFQYRNMWASSLRNAMAAVTTRIRPVSTAAGAQAANHTKPLVDISKLPVVGRISDTEVTENEVAQYKAALKNCWIAVLEKQ
jgi:hypothetical protein